MFIFVSGSGLQPKPKAIQASQSPTFGISNQNREKISSSTFVELNKGNYESRSNVTSLQKSSSASLGFIKINSPNTTVNLNGITDKTNNLVSTPSGFVKVGSSDINPNNVNSTPSGLGKVTSSDIHSKPPTSAFPSRSNSVSKQANSSQKCLIEVIGNIASNAAGKNGISTSQISVPHTAGQMSNSFTKQTSSSVLTSSNQQSLCNGVVNCSMTSVTAPTLLSATADDPLSLPTMVNTRTMAPLTSDDTPNHVKASSFIAISNSGHDTDFSMIADPDTHEDLTDFSQYKGWLSMNSGDRKIRSSADAFKCRFCDQTFEKSRKLKEHMMQDHGSVAKPFTCDYCKKTFSEACYLKEHLNVHTGYRPYICNICYKGFHNKDGLRQHKVIHLAVKPYSCGACSKQFAQRGQYVRHKLKCKKQLHCDTCNKQFLHKNNLEKHMLVHLMKSEVMLERTPSPPQQPSS